MRASRERKLEHFYSLCKGGKVLDVGVSGKTTMDAGNMFMNTFRFADECYTGLGVVDLSDVQKMFPERKFVKYPGDIFPFEDNSFDWVFSNAVVEHVGLDHDQLRFINEMLRVGRNVFFTTPNKYFPIEPHTHVPLIHWNNRLFYAWCRRKRPWTNQRNLYLLGYRRLKELMEASDASEYQIFTNRLAFLPMTFTVVCRKASDRQGSTGAAA